MKCVLTIGLCTLFSFIGRAQWPNELIRTELGTCQSLLPHLQKFETLGIKENGSQALENTGSWIFDELISYGYIASYDSFLHPSGKWQRNVIATRRGNKDDFILVGAHYDSRNGPGVNDNGTGVAVVLETARILSGHQPNLTIRFVFFSAEEDGFWGSKHHAERLSKEAGGKLLLMLNVDQVGGRSDAGVDKIFCERDEGNVIVNNDQLSALFTDTLARIFEIYTSFTPVISAAYSSDYMSFEALGYPITGLYQFPDYPYRHTKNDSLKYVDTLYVQEALKGCVASVLHFSGVPGMVGLDVKKEKDLLKLVVRNGRIFFPDNQEGPSKCVIGDYAGRFREIQNPGNSVDVDDLASGVYWIRLDYENSVAFGKFIKL